MRLATTLVALLGGAAVVAATAAGAGAGGPGGMPGPPMGLSDTPAAAAEVSGWKPWEIGNLARERPELAARANYHALQWEEDQMKRRIDGGGGWGSGARRRQQQRQQQQQRMMEQRASQVPGAPHWYHYMPPWWERPDVPEMPQSDFAQQPGLRSIAHSPPGVMPYFAPFDHIMLEEEARAAPRVPHPLERAHADRGQES